MRDFCRNLYLVFADPGTVHAGCPAIMAVAGGSRICIGLARLHCINMYRGLIVPHWAGCGFGMLLLGQHIDAIPEAVFEAAHLDGAGDGYVLVSVALPLPRAGDRGPRSPVM
jgi:ABC-type glycerol-3-phosphate transport system permease component